MPILEPNVYGLWAGKQTAKGTPLSAPTRRLVQVAGDFGVSRDEGTEEYSDLSKYGSATDWFNSVSGAGEPGLEATPTELAWLLWAFHGGEAVTAVTGPPAAQKHTTIPTSGIGHPLTFWVRVGQSVIRRQKFNDCYITRLQIEGSTANKAVRVTPRIMSLDPGEVFATDPTTPTLPTDKPFLYTDVKASGAATFTIDTVAFSGQSQFTFVVDDAWDVIYGDDASPFDFVQGNPSVTIACTVAMDATALAQYNKMVYGTATPAAGTKPLKGVAALGSYTFYMKARDGAGALTGREFKLTIPGVKWALPDAPGPNPSGGATEIALAGVMRPTSPYVPGTGWTTPPYTIDVNTSNTDLAFTS